ncbi:helix-turn-helix domain-containing protein [Actinomadura rubrisoli]|uniref:XRE family transcriptional regulator n=1 Tax=Actinomadura rubrisoli TaxID=2530368 RepID=A0A4R5BZ39_9ACTN|nr:helix-turn-helix transcriptional regulator [Actinomadura rubrisoli]TDD92501.1 XRE family transcriptional regulator [Actinomadura rubrisoli]
MDQRTELGEFLRSRRARLRPEDVGLPAALGKRRVPGLRREELAQLAGVSVDYYVRLEQGRARNASATVLDAVAQALRLNEDEYAYLRNIAKPVPARRRPARPERVRPGLQRLLDMSASVPAYVVGRRVDVLAWNRAACALFTDFAARPPGGRNWARMIFLEQEIRDLFDDWTVKARETVSYLRMQAGSRPDDTELAALVGELSVKSGDFRHWWASHEVHDKAHGRKHLRHPVAGDLVLDFETLRLPSDPDQVLVTYTAEAGSPSEEALNFLTSWSADTPDRAERTS